MKSVYSKSNNHEKIRIKKLYLGKMKDSVAELETNFASQTPSDNELLASSFIS